MHASNPKSSTTARHFCGPPAMPTTRAPAILAICPATDPVAPAARAPPPRPPGWGPADVGHTEVGGGTGRAVHRHDRQLVVLTRDGCAEHVVADDHVLLEAGQRRDDISDGVGVATRRDDLADPGRPNDFAQLHGRKVARLVVQPGPDRGVEPDVGGS